MFRTLFASVCSGALTVGAAHAAIISVSGPASSAGTAPEIIAAPAHALDDIVTNTGMQGFNEAQRKLTSIAFAADGGGVIPAGSTVDSHMIFLNSEGTARLSHSNVVWTFATPIIAVMSDFFGNFEAASSAELGAPGTNYTMTGPGQRAAPFTSRGMDGGDSYVVAGNMITVTMSVTEPGDWIRVVTAATPIPLPATLPLALTGLLALGWTVRRRRRPTA